MNSPDRSDDRFLAQARCRWPELSDEELHRGEGQPALLADMVQKRYAISLKMAEKQVEGFYLRFPGPASPV